MLRMRLLAVVRLSDLTDDSTSPERQRTRITTYAKLHDHEVVGLAEDLDVSGAVSPFDRPQLGPWLMRLVEWGDLIIAKYDRLTRSLLDFLMLYEWLRDRGKTLIWIDPPLDFSTPFGKAMANVLITFAGPELAVISDRIREAWPALREAGKWPGGFVPFGRIPVWAEPNGWQLIRASDPGRSVFPAGLTGSRQADNARASCPTGHHLGFLAPRNTARAIPAMPPARPRLPAR
jgi:site-specific DNA recombinase